MSFVPIKLELEATFACRHCDGEFPMTQSHEDYFGNQWLGYSCPKCNARHQFRPVGEPARLWTMGRWLRLSVVLFRVVQSLRKLTTRITVVRS